MLPRLARPVALFLLLSAPLAALRAEEEKKPETVVTVSVGKIVRTTLHAYVTGYGTVETSPTGGARLAASAAGLVVAVSGIEGAKVEKETIVVQLDSRAADAALARARTAVANAEKARNRQTQLLAAEGTSERAMQETGDRLATAYAEVAAAQLQQSQLAIRSPLAGTLARIAVKPGEWLDAGKEVGEVIDADRLTVALQLPSHEAAAVQSGQTAALFARLASDEKPLTESTVQFVAPVVTPATDTVLVRLALPKASGVRPGKFTAVRIATETRADKLAVPSESIVTDGEGHSTISIVEKDVAKQQPVQVGLRDGDLVEISGDGIAEGATVVTVGAYGLPKETKIRVLTPATKEAAK